MEFCARIEVPKNAAAGIVWQNMPSRLSSGGGCGRLRRSYRRKMTHVNMATVAYAPKVVGRSMLKDSVVISSFLNIVCRKLLVFR